MMKGLFFQQQQHVVEDNISNLTSASGDQVSVSSDNRAMFPNLSPPAQPQPPPKKKRNLPGNPDPDAEVIALSPISLMATNRFVCDICNKGFQRDQNLQLHRRGHNLPWKLKQRTSREIRKKVYVCPERSCVHHDPSKALGDLTGIKKHFCRKHGEKKWKCDKCSKLYAVRSDLKAHSKTCGTREYRCDCGTLFSRRDSYISHRALCDALAQESARSINGNMNPYLSSQPGSSSTSHINLQMQPQYETSHGHGMQAFPLKKEPQTFDFKPEAPQWLTFQQEFRSGPSPGPGPSPIFSTRFYEQDLSAHHEGRNPNPNDLGIDCLPPYQFTSPTPNNPVISATALLQKATQMGATMSNSSKSSSPSSVPPMFQGPHQLHVSAESSNNNSNLFGLNMASREDLATGFVYNFGNKAAASTVTGTSGHSSTLLQDMMTSFSSSSGFEGSTFEDAFGGFLNPKRDDVSDHLHETLSKTNSHQFSRVEKGGGAAGGGGSGGGGYDGMTRDFLGLRPIAHSDFFDIAGLSNCMNASSGEHQNQNQKPWQD